MIRAFLALMAVAPLAAGAQPVHPPNSALDEFRKVAAAHERLARYDLRIEVAHEGEVAPLMRAEARCLATDRCLRIMGALSVLQTPKWLIVVDSGARTVFVSERVAAAAPLRAAITPGDVLDAWLMSGAEISDGGLAEAGRRWVLAPADRRLPGAELFTDPETRLLRRILFGVVKHEGGIGRVSITYTWNDQSNLDPASFDESRYVVEHHGNMVPAGEYEGYRLLRADRR